MSTAKSSKKGSTKSSSVKKSSSSSSSKLHATTDDTATHHNGKHHTQDLSDEEANDDGASILEQFIDGISALPADIIKSLQLMRDLDDQSNGIVNQVRQQIAYHNTARRQIDHGDGLDHHTNDSSMMDVNDDHDDDDDDQFIDDETMQDYVDEKFQEALMLSEEKIQLSVKCYEEVDKCIRKLDEELARFSRRLGEPVPNLPQSQSQPNSHIARTMHQNHRIVYDALTGHLPHESTTPAHLQQQQQRQQHYHHHQQQQQRTNNFVTTGAGITGTASQSYMLTHLDNNYYRHTGAPINMPQSTSIPANAVQSSMLHHHPTASSYQQESTGGRRKISSTLPVAGSVVSGPASTSTSGVIENDMPVDPNEPVYCICQRVSFGDMVACDNDTCPFEWFHFQCVGLTESPKGKWFCPHCREQSKAASSSSSATVGHSSKNKTQRR